MFNWLRNIAGSRHVVLVALMLMCFSTVYVVGKAGYSRIYESSSQGEESVVVEDIAEDLDLEEIPVMKAEICSVWTSENGEGFSLMPGDLAYFEEGYLHNAHGPAVIRADGTNEYWIWGMKFTDPDMYMTFALTARETEGNSRGLRTVFDGFEHRVAPVLPELAFGEVRSTKDDVLEDIFGPAIDGPLDYEGHYQNGVAHNEDGPAIVSTLGTKAWVKNGIVSREDGPAVEFADGTLWYIVDGKFHRVDGPAIMYPNLDKADEYWLDGKQMTKEAFDDATKVVSSEYDGSSEPYSFCFTPSYPSQRPMPLP